MSQTHACQFTPRHTITATLTVEDLAVCAATDGLVADLLVHPALLSNNNLIKQDEMK